MAKKRKKSVIKKSRPASFGALRKLSIVGLPAFGGVFSRPLDSEPQDPLQIPSREIVEIQFT